MKLLSDILYKAGIEEVIGSTNVAVRSICFDSRKVEKDSLFVASIGTQVDGHSFISKAIDAGAIAIVCERIPEIRKDNVSYVRVKESNRALGIIASNFYGNPSSKLKLIGITGTNGKTTVATLLYNLFQSLGHKTGLISTVESKIGKEKIDSTLTTPDAIQLNSIIKDMVNQSCEFCFMEVSSHAIHQNRIAGLEFTGGAFTNITHDHLDYHNSFDEYINVKKSFFDNLSANAFSIVNKDDKHGIVMQQNTNATKYTYSMRSMANYKCKIMENQFSGLLLNIDGHEVWSKLIGEFNGFNILAVYAIANLLNQETLPVLTSLSNMNPVEGRFECLKYENGIIGIVDYAHTPDALNNVLSTIAKIRTKNETLITIIGCGGDRDVYKRPLMAQIASELSDKVILTSDNPRSEDPESIINDMKQGIEGLYANKVIAIPDRREAIKTACMMAKPDDIILVAGKGHEKYQEIKGVKYPFDDKMVLKESCKMTNNLK